MLKVEAGREGEERLTVYDTLGVVDRRVKGAADLDGLFLHQRDELLEVSECKGA